MARTVTPVVLVGGRGARLWPTSRETLPKVFQKLTSDNSLLQDTCERLSGAVGMAAPLVVCNRSHAFLVRDQLATNAGGAPKILAEPARRNTAPAIAAAAVWLAKTDPDTIMLVLPADHVITDTDKFHAAVRRASAIADTGRLVAFGIQPDRPETEYGYIRAGRCLDGDTDAYEISRFLEKPDVATAQSLIDAGGHFWNSGMFLFSARTLLEDMRQHAPDVLDAVTRAVNACVEHRDQVNLDNTEFSSSPSISIDYALMERTSRAAVVPCDFGWSDVGNWNALWALETRNADQNAHIGNAVSRDSNNSYFRSEGPLVVGIGLENVVVVATDDAVLVGDRAQVRSVNDAVDTLAQAKHPEAENHRKILKPWGFYETLRAGEGFQVKRICVNPGAKLSLQKHNQRSEHWVIVEGSARVTRDDHIAYLAENESIFLPTGCIHRLENPNDTVTTFIEIQYGTYLGEDDIIRIEDDYGRV